MARAAAYGDIDNDGFLDVLLTTNAGPAYLFHNEVERITACVSSSWARSRIAMDRRGCPGELGKRQAMEDAAVRIKLSFASELVLTFGMGAQAKADSVEIQWPSGQVDKLSNIDAGQTVTVEEGKGVISKRAMARKKQKPRRVRRFTRKDGPLAKSVSFVILRVLCG